MGTDSRASRGNGKIRVSKISEGKKKESIEQDSGMEAGDSQREIGADWDESRESAHGNQESRQSSHVESTVDEGSEESNAESNANNDDAVYSEEDSEDYYGVQQLSNNFESLLLAISARVKELGEATQQSVESKHRAVLKNEMLEADKQIASTHRVLKLCDELEHELLKIRQIGEIAADFKKRIATIDSEIS